MTTIDTHPDTDLDAVHLRLHHAGILDDPRRQQEPFKSFEVAYNNFVSATYGKADPDIIDQHRLAARAVTPAVVAALGDTPAQVVEINDGATPVAPATKEPTIAPANAGVPVKSPLAVPEAVESTTKATGMTQAQESPATTNTNAIHTVEIEFHPVANIFPLMTDADLQKLADDIKENGLRDAIWLHDGKIIDGRNRYRACRLAGREPTYQEWDGKGSLVTFILSLNLHRRHLTDQQRALVAAKAKAEFEAEALGRSRSNLLQNKASTEGLDPAPRSEGKSADRAAAQLHVSIDATKKADKVLKAGAPELVTALEQGTVSLDAAALMAALPKDEQKEIVSGGKVKEKAKQLRDEKKSRANPVKSSPDPTPATTPPASAAPPAPTVAPLGPTEPVTVTRKQAAAVLVTLARAKPAVADEIINEIADAASRDVLVLEPDVRQGVSELATLLTRKIEELAQQDYDDARSRVESICADLWDAVNTYAREGNGAETE